MSARSDLPGSHASPKGALLAQHVAELGLAKTQQIIDLFIDTVPATVAQARRAIHEGNGKLLVSAAHRVKSSASTIGLGSLAKMAAALEAAAVAGHHAQVEVLMAELANGLPEALAGLQRLWAEVQRQHAVPK